jgi:hypothetical protein
MSMLRAKGFRLTYFSSTTGEAICRVKASKILPARKRAGPFLMPAPGYELRQPEIDIIPGVCAAEDWDSLAGHLAGLRYFTLREAITLRLAAPANDAGGAADAGATWRATGAPVLRTTPETALHFTALDDAGHRVRLLLRRDAGTGALVLQTLRHPAAPRASFFSSRQQTPQPPSS